MVSVPKSRLACVKFTLSHYNPAKASFEGQQDAKL